MGAHEVALESLAAEPLVQVAFAGVGLPTDPGHRIVLEQDEPLHRHPTGDTVRRRTEIEQVDHVGQLTT
jgi:hypothetical protein